VLGARAPASKPFVAWIYQYGEGNPFFTEEILRAIVDADDGPGVQLNPSAIPAVIIPSSVREAILARMNHLMPEGRGVLGAAAVLGRTFDLQALQEVSGLVGDAFSQAFMSLLSLHLVRADRAPLRYDFRHHLIREVIMQHLAPDVRRALHRRVGKVLETRAAPSTPPQILAHHFSEAGDHEKTVRYALAAASHASSVYAHEETAKYLASALDALPAGPTKIRLSITEDLGDSLFHAGQLDRALDAYETMRQCAEVLDTRRELARAYRKLGRVQNERSPGTGLPAWEKGLAIVTEINDPLEEAMIREQASKIAYLMGEYEQGAVEARAALAAATRAGDLGAQSRAHKSLGLNLWAQEQELDSIQGHFEQALALARQTDDVEAELKALTDIGAWAREHLAFHDARVALERACELVQKVGEIPTLLLPLGGLALLSLLEGRWEEAETLWVRTTTILFQRHASPWPFAQHAANLAELYALRGRLNEAEALLDKAQTAAEAARDARTQAMIQNARATIEFRRGNVSRASALLESALKVTDARWVNAESLLLLSEAHLSLGDIGQGRRVSEKAAQAAAFMPYLAPRVLCLKGQVAAQAGDFEEALRQYQAGLDSMSSAPQPYYEALIKYQVGICLLRRSRPGDRKAARAHLTEALVILTRLDAKPDTELVEQALRRIGGRTPTGNMLTEREHEVMNLLAEGLSNAAIAGRLYISERTVEAHVSHILNKLRLESRTQVAAWATQHGTSRTTR
jgi:DNA-binding CsgD family transcriptional regulator/tetratricopeptide (TPR) repeat protein